MKNILALLIFVLAISHAILAQTTPIPQENYQLLYVSSDNTNHPASHAYDNDTTTWWALYNTEGYSLPGVIHLDLGENHDVCGFSYLCNSANLNTRATDFEIFVSNDTLNWGTPETAGSMIWIDNDISRKYIYFGAVDGRYLRLVYLDNTSVSDPNIHTTDLVFYQDPGGATGQQNQTISFDAIANLLATSDPFELTAASSSGLEVVFEIVSGPAIIEGNMLTLTGQGGIVMVKASQEGNTNYYPTEAYQSFEVYDATSYYPEVNTKFTDSFDYQMPELLAIPLYAYATIDLPQFFEIDHVDFIIDGETLEAEKVRNSWLLWWLPESWGEHSIEVVATASNSNSSTESIIINISDEIADQNVQTFDHDLIQWGQTSQWFYGAYELPQFVGAFNQITANFSTNCPATSNGCDDWDRLAWIDIKGPEGNWIELIRYITPYGVGCSHSLDVSDYMSLLQGKVELRMYIQTWGTGGWEINLDFDYFAGQPDRLYSHVDVIWDGTFQFGDPANLQPLDTVSTTFDDNVLEAKLKLVTSGHGWGAENTGNAAEFYHAIHDIKVNGNETFMQDLWVDCDPNPDNCTGQMGTWQYDRAGWCPGTVAAVYEYDLSEFIPEETISLSYIFDESYTDLCHPNNPDCVTGVTCSDCNAGVNPQYVVSGNLITYSQAPVLTNITNNQVVSPDEDFNFEIFPIPSDGKVILTTKVSFNQAVVTVYSLEGLLVYKTYLNQNNNENMFNINLDHLASGTYYVQVMTKTSTGVKQIIVN